MTDAFDKELEFNRELYNQMELFANNNSNRNKYFSNVQQMIEDSYLLKSEVKKAIEGKMVKKNLERDGAGVIIKDVINATLSDLLTLLKIGD